MRQLRVSRKENTALEVAMARQPGVGENVKGRAGAAMLAMGCNYTDASLD